MVVRLASRQKAAARFPRSYWIAGIVAAVVLLGGTAIVWRGCSRARSDPYAAWGGMSQEEFLKKRKERAEADAKKEAEEAKRASEAKKKKDEEDAARRLAAEKKAKPQRKVVRSDSDDEDGQPVAEKSPALPSLPREFTEWKDFDYFVARLTNNPRLAMAVEHRSNSAPRDERQAEFFEKLLAPQLLAELKEFAGSRRSSEDEDRDAPTAAIEAIANALGRNGTVPAQRTLAALLAGTLTVENDQAAVVAALKALALNPSDQNDRLLAMAVFAPERLRAVGQRQMTPESLRQQAVAAIGQYGRSGVRLLAARQFVDPACAPEARKLLGPFWLRAHPENLEAYAFLNERPEVDAQVRNQIMRHLMELSGRAVRHFLGIAGVEAPAQAAEAEPPDPELPYRVARQLWNADLARAIDARRTTVRSMEEARELVLLATTVPRSDVRSRMIRVVERRWEEGPPVAMSSGGYGKETVVVEPGSLAVLKSVRRNRPEAKQTTAKTRGNPGQKVLQLPKDPWLDFEEALVRDFCHRFSEAAVRPDRGAEDEKPASGGGEGEASLPVALHPRADVVAQYCVRWPGRHAAKLASILPEPMEVSYVRVEQKARPMSVRGHYERTLKGQKVHPLKDGIWIESLLPASKEGRTRSIDVLLTRANPKADTPPEEPQELTVEILAVDIPALDASLGAKRQAAADPDTDAGP